MVLAGSVYLCLAGSGVGKALAAGLCGCVEFSSVISSGLLVRVYGEFSDRDLSQGVPNGEGLSLGKLLGVGGQCGVNGDVYGSLEESAVGTVVHDAGIGGAVVAAGVPTDEAYRSLRQADFVDGDIGVFVVCNGLYRSRRLAGSAGIYGNRGDCCRN